MFDIFEMEKKKGQNMFLSKGRYSYKTQNCEMVVVVKCRYISIVRYS